MAMQVMIRGIIIPHPQRLRRCSQRARRCGSCRFYGLINEDSEFAPIVPSGDMFPLVQRNRGGTGDRLGGIA